jgi:predicted ATPase
MITLVTGYNNTGKTTWIINEITKAIGYFNKEYLFKNPSEFDNNITSSYYKLFNKYSFCTSTHLFHTDNKNIFYFNQPENGLHPSFQSKLAEEFIKLHNEGYDLYIETYSDHIINSIRVAIKQGLIKSNDVKVLFFKAANDIVEIKIDKRGTTNIEIDGFCDEYEKHLIALL